MALKDKRLLVSVTNFGNQFYIDLRIDQQYDTLFQLLDTSEFSYLVKVRVRASKVK